MFPTAFDRGRFTFRIEPLQDGGLRLWLEAFTLPEDGAPSEVDPTTLDKEEADELAKLIDAIGALLNRARARCSPPLPSDPPPPKPPPGPQSTTPRFQRPRRRRGAN
ncbi:MAG TPA: hypothetical protein VG963_14780 [Polyangiaceae bacterium]|nr:hypothetical protein [Polyangiaceae bacterium]